MDFIAGWAGRKFFDSECSDCEVFPGLRHHESERILSNVINLFMTYRNPLPHFGPVLRLAQFSFLLLFAVVLVEQR